MRVHHPVFALTASLLAAMLLAAAPSGLGASWRAAEARWPWLLAPWPFYALLLFAGALAGRDADDRRAVSLLPLLAAAPALLLKPGFATPGGWLLIQAVVAIGLAVLAARSVSRPGMVALLALLGLLAVSYDVRAELVRREREVVDGRVELLLRELADTIGRDTADHGPPPAEGALWLTERLDAQGWSAAENGDWYWAPSAGLPPGPIRLRYTPPDEADSAWAVVLRSVAQPLRDPRSRPFTAELTADGGLTWAWPEGPPAAVAAQRATVGG